MTKRYKKPDRERFVKIMTEYFKSVMHHEKDGKYHLDTPVGWYEVRRIEASDNMLSVFGAFRRDYVKAINHGYMCNPYTGKYNFHMCDSVDEVTEHIQEWFNRMLNQPILTKKD